MLGQLNIHMQKMTQLLCHTIHKNELKMDHRPHLNVKTNIMKLLEESIGENLCDSWMWQKNTRDKRKIDKLDLKLKTSTFQKMPSRK